jgi:maltose O-acetyltransferase
LSNRQLFRDVVINGFSASVITPRHLRWVLLRLYGARIGRASVGARCFFGDSNISIGQSAYINYGVFFDGASSIAIGNKVHIGMQVMILTSGHALGGSDCRAGDLKPSPVVIGDGCWIGARAMILPGVNIGAGTIIASGSVVTSSCDPNSLYAGSPARKVKALPEDIQKVSCVPDLEVS